VKKTARKISRLKHYTKKEMQAMAKISAQKYGLNPAYFMRQIGQESTWRQFIVSKQGAIGVAQIIPSTAEQWKVNPWDPKQALDVSARETAKNIRHQRKAGYNAKQAWAIAMSLYNSGRKYTYMNPRFAKGETYNYVRIILGETPVVPIPKKKRKTVQVASAPVPGGK
jgi:soluble lytic murein transglycosylase-like protein